MYVEREEAENIWVRWATSFTSLFCYVLQRFCKIASAQFFPWLFLPQADGCISTGFLELFTSVVCNFETEINVVFSKFSQPEKNALQCITGTHV